MESIKLVVVGDSMVGKTSLLARYSSGDFPDVDMRHVYDNYSANVMVDEQPVSLELCDTASQSDYDSLRPLSYKSTDVFLVCYSIDDVESLNNIETKWVPEIRPFAGQAVPIVLVGLKCDVRDKDSVTEMDRQRIAESIDAAELVECSALNDVGVKEVFESSIRTTREYNDVLGGKARNFCSAPTKRRSSLCNLL